MSRSSVLFALCFLVACPDEEEDVVPVDDDDAADDDDSAPTDDDDDSAATDDDDSAEPVDPEPCTWDGLDALPMESLPLQVELGEFTVQVDGAILRAAATAAPARAVFSSPPGRAWLNLLEADLHAEEHQGSFELKENLGRRCTDLRVDGAHHGWDSLLIRGGFDDPGCEEASFEARLCPAGTGRLGLEVDSLSDAFGAVALRTESDSEERIWGAGEQFPHESLNLKGRSIPILAQEGGLGRGHRPITPAVEQFSEGSGGSEDSTYYAAAHYVTSRNRSLFLENTETAWLDFSADSAIEARLHGRQMRAQLVAGSDLFTLIERFTDWTGRMPAPPEWANQGAIVALARPLAESLGHVDALLAENAALAGVWNQTWSGTVETFIGEQVLWNWVLNESTHPDWHDWVDDLEDRGLRVLCYVNSMFRELPEEVGPVSRDLFQEGMAAGHFVRDEADEVMMLPVTAFDVALLDLSSEDAREWMKTILHDEVLDGGRCSGWMADFAEALPFEAHMADGETGVTWHNRYPVEWARLQREAITEAGRLGDVLVYNRSGHTASPGASLLLWQGDQLVTWDKYDGLVSALHGLIGGGFSGIALNHSDIGGYTSMAWLGLGYTRGSQLLKRWTEMAAFTTIMRTHEGNQPSLNAQVYSDQDDREHFARMTRVYRALAFYRTELFAEAETRGIPVVRHLAMHYPDEDDLLDVDDQFLLGSEILVAPVKNKCFTWPICPFNKDVVLPPGEWVHLWTGEVHGSLMDASTVTVSAPIGEPAVFYRRGSDVGATFVANLLDEGFDVQLPR